MSVRLCLSLSLLLFGWPFLAQADEKTPQINVSGAATIHAVPDQVVVELTVTTTDDDLQRARKTSDADAQAVFDLVKKAAAVGSQAEVTRLDLKLDYNEQLRRQIYEVERDITVTLGDLSKLDAVLSGLLADRNLKISSISFETSKAKELESEARRLAVNDAKAKAGQLAELTGVKLGPAIRIAIGNEEFRPFVTSVVPVVGQNQRGNRPPGGGGLFHVPENGPPEIANRKIALPREPGSRFTALLQAGPAGGSALGTIAVEAEVHVDYAIVP